MKFEVNVDKKYFFAIILIGLIIVGIVGVIAANPAVFGHKTDEIDWSIPITKNITAAGFCIGTPTNCINLTGSSSTFNVGGGNVTQIVNGTGISMAYTGSTPGTGIVTISTTGGAPVGQWAPVSGGISYDGNVGIGVASPSAKLDVFGDVKMRSYGNFGEDSYGAWGSLSVGDTDNCDTNNVLEYNCSVEALKANCIDVKNTQKRTVNCVRANSGLDVTKGVVSARFIDADVIVANRIVWKNQLAQDLGIASGKQIYQINNSYCNGYTAWGVLTTSATCTTRAQTPQPSCASNSGATRFYDCNGCTGCACPANPSGPAICLNALLGVIHSYA